MKDIKHIVRSVKIGIAGLRHAYRSDKSFRLEVLYGIPLYIFVGWLLAPLSPIELSLYVLSYFLIVIVELVNTAFEKMLDKVHPEEHELIGKSKDISAAAVLVAFCFAIIVVGILFYTHVLMHTAFSLSGNYV